MNQMSIIRTCDPIKEQYVKAAFVDKGGTGYTLTADISQAALFLNEDAFTNKILQFIQSDYPDAELFPVVEEQR